MINKFIKEDINNRLKLLKRIQQLEYVNALEIQDLFGYDRNKSIELVELFLNNTERYEGTVILCVHHKITSLGKLKYIGGGLDLCTANIESLGDLEYIGKSLIANEHLKNFGKLKYIGGYLDIPDNFPISNETIKYELNIKISNDILR